VSALVDWTLAERIVRATTADGTGSMPSGADLQDASARSREAVVAYTGLKPAEDLPDAEWVSRRGWAEMNLRGMREMLAPLEVRLARSFKGPGGSALGAVAGRVVALEIGGLLAIASKRVLGQYEFSMRGAERAPRLVFVGANIEVAAGQLPATPDEVLEWVALHETTHAVHFGSAPWLGKHIAGLADQLLADAPLSLSGAEVLAGARRLATSDPRRLIAELRANDPVTLLAPAASRATIAEVQAAMAAVEGYAEHVMDAAAGRLGPAVVELRAAMERRRDGRSALARLLSWLLGFEMKLRQYRDGKRFADDVVGRAGIEGLNAAWNGPDSLPRLPELSDPELWLARVAAAPAAA
jgi:coenzyme F420 biosynthesis associated uncharacterized protein